MKKIITAAIFLVAVSLAAFAQPKLEIVGGDTYNWGNTPPKVLFADIYIKNTGNKALFISQVKPDCSCTTAPLDKNTVEPGDKAKLKVNLSLNVANSGQVKKHIKIYSNDPKNPEKTLTLKCNVVMPFQIEPHNYLRFKDATIGLRSIAHYTIKNKTGETVTFSHFEMSDNLSINWKKKVTVGPGKTAKLTVTFTPNKSGYQSLSLKFKTSYEQMRFLTISGGTNVSEAGYYGY